MTITSDALILIQVLLENSYRTRGPPSIASACNVQDFQHVGTTTTTNAEIFIIPIIII